MCTQIVKLPDASYGRSFGFVLYFIQNRNVLVLFTQDLKMVVSFESEKSKGGVVGINYVLVRKERMKPGYLEIVLKYLPCIGKALKLFKFLLQTHLCQKSWLNLKKSSRFPFTLNLAFTTIVIPPHSVNKVWGGRVYSNHLVRLFVFCAIVPGPYLSFGKHLKFLLYTTIAHDLRVCHDSDQRSFGQVESDWKEKSIISVWSVFSLIEKH